MLSMGDEVGRTQDGNNNAYCQDNELSWMDWSLLKTQADLFQFAKQLLQFNLHTEFFQEKFYWNAPMELTGTTFTAHGTTLGEPDWTNHSHALAFTLSNPNYGKSLHIMINAFWGDLQFELPHQKQEHWQLILNTAASAAPHFFSSEKAAFVKTNYQLVKARSIIILEAKEKIATE
jgi:glycogen operon protein